MLPRLGRSRRGPWQRATAVAWKGVVVGIVLVVVIGMVQVIRTRLRAERDREITRWISDASDAERAGDVGRAYHAIEKAMEQARRDPSRPYAGIDDLRRRRDTLAAKDAEHQLAHFAGKPREETIRVCEDLLARAESDAAIAHLVPRLTGQLAQALGEELAQAAGAVETGRWSQIIQTCETAYSKSRLLADADGVRIREDARAVVCRVVAQAGVELGPVTGTFVRGRGSAEAHAAAEFPALADALRAGGYLPRPARSPFSRCWDESAPYRVAIDVRESDDAAYMQTPCYTTRIDSRIRLSYRDHVLWQIQFTTRGPVPSPSVSQFEVGRVAAERKRDEDVERRLYSDALGAVAAEIPQKIRGLPPPPTRGTPNLPAKPMMTSG